VPAIGEKERKFMTKPTKIAYADEPIGKIRIIKDFLPPPEALLLKEDSVKITLSLSRESVDFFKKIAEEKNVSYQKMIRSLVDQYASHYRETDAH